MAPNSENRDPRSMSRLFSELSHEMTDLLRHEMALAKAELSEKVSQAGSGVASLSIGGLVAFAGLLVLLASAVFALSNIMALWLSALIVGGIVLVVGLVMLQKGRSNLKPKNLVPHQTARTVRADKDFIKEHVK